MKPFYRFCYWFLNGYFRLFYRLKVYGQENIPEGPALLASNHVSFYDPPLIGTATPEEIHYLAGEHLYHNPLLRLIITNLNAHPIHGSTNDLSTFKLICHLLNEGDKVVIFPEGARSEDGQLAEIKSGVGMLALRSEAPIVPIYINGAFKVWPIQKSFPKPWGKIRLIFGKPIDWRPYSAMEKKEAYEAISQDVEKAILELKQSLTSR